MARPFALTAIDWPWPIWGWLRKPAHLFIYKQSTDDTGTGSRSWGSQTVRQSGRRHTQVLQICRQMRETSQRILDSSICGGRTWQWLINFTPFIVRFSRAQLKPYKSITGRGGAGHLRGAGHALACLLGQLAKHTMYTHALCMAPAGPTRASTDPATVVYIYIYIYIHVCVCT